MHVSAATVWELTIKTMLGKLTVPADLGTRLTGQGLELLRVTAEHVLLDLRRDFILDASR